MERLERLREIHARVHVAAFGFSRPEHVLQPLRIMKADAFFLLENNEDRAFEYHRRKGLNVYHQLDKVGIPWERVKVDLWNPAAVAATLRNLIRDNKLEELLVNASVGPNTVAIGATLASLFAPIRLYHPAGAKPSEPLRSLDEVAYLPSFQVKGWTAGHVSILKALSELGGAASGESLKARLRKSDPDVIGGGRGRGNWAQREHARFQGLVGFLADSAAVQVQKAKRRWTLRLTESGKHMGTLLADLSHERTAS